MAAQNYRDLIAWQKAMDLVLSIYAETRRLPKEETYGLRSQMRGSVTSIPCNIAEGQGRRTKGEFVNFLSIAHGSVRELETQLMICQRLGYFSDAISEPLLQRAAEVGRLISGLANSLREG